MEPEGRGALAAGAPLEAVIAAAERKEGNKQLTKPSAERTPTHPPAPVGSEAAQLRPARRALKRGVEELNLQQVKMGAKQTQYFCAKVTNAQLAALKKNAVAFKPGE